MNWLFIPHLISGLLVIALGARVYNNDRLQRTNQLFGLLCVGLSWWLLGLFISEQTSSVDAFLLWERFSYIGATLIPVLGVHFVVSFIGSAPKSLFVVCKVYYVYLVVFLLTMFLTPAFPTSVHIYSWGMYLKANALITVNLIFGLCAVLIVYAVSLGWYLKIGRGKSGQEHDRLRYMLVALACFVWIVVDYVPKYGVGIYPVGFIAVDLFVVIVTYAILKHRLFNVVIILRNSVVYSILIALLTSTYMVLVLLVERQLKNVVGYNTLFASIGTSFVIAFSFNPIKNWVQSFVDHYFFRGTQVSIAAENERLRGEVQQSEKLKAVSLFASGMAHEIKNPLTSLKTFAEYLPEKGADPAFRAKFSQIVGAEVGRIQTTVQRLLDFSKPVSPLLQPISASQVLEETLDFLQNNLVQKQLHLSRNFVTPDTLHADPAQLKQAFLNLLLNAIEATPQGGMITVHTVPTGQHITITIADTGQGIDPHSISRLGEPFYTTKPHGTGLGLSVVHSIVEQHQGTLTIMRQPGQGTQVQMELPCDSRTPAEVLVPC